MAPVSFWAEKPPDMLRLWFAFSARTQLLVVLADVEIIDYPRVELSEKLRLLMKYFERKGEDWCCPKAQWGGLLLLGVWVLGALVGVRWADAVVRMLQVCIRWLCELLRGFCPGF